MLFENWWSLRKTCSWTIFSLFQDIFYCLWSVLLTSPAPQLEQLLFTVLFMTSLQFHHTPFLRLTPRPLKPTGLSQEGSCSSKPHTMPLKWWVENYLWPKMRVLRTPPLREAVYQQAAECKALLVNTSPQFKQDTELSVAGQLIET